MGGNAPDVTTVEWRGVRPGDTLVGVINDHGRTVMLDTGYHIVRVDDADAACPYRGYRVDEHPSYEAWLPFYGPRVLIRSRPGQSGDADFPHRCPRCGRPAYIGLLKVIHETGVEECPTST